MALKISKGSAISTKRVTKGQSAPPPAVDQRRSEAFKTEYANNVMLEYSAWDLKLIFGQTDQSIGQNSVIQHTGISVPWPQVKVLLYYLQIHLSVHEIEFGRILVPKGVIAEVPPPTEQAAKDFPATVQIFEKLSELRGEFLAANPEAAAGSSNG